MLEMKIGSSVSEMNWLEWSSSVISSLAWPVAAVIVACIFRAQISNLLKSVRKFSWGDKTLDFSGNLDKIENVSRTSFAGPLAEQPRKPLPPDDRFQQLLEISPAAAVLDAWIPVENKLRWIGQDHMKAFNASQINSHMYRPLEVRSMLGILLSQEKIDKDSYVIISEMQNLRNSAAHQGDVSAVDAVRFRDLAGQVSAVLDRVQFTNEIK